MRDQGLCGEHLETVFQALIISRLSYALTAWGGFITTEQSGKINAFLKRSLKYGLTQKCFNINEILCKADCTLFKAIQLSGNCLHSILSPHKSSLVNLRACGHNFELPICKTIIHKQSFIPRCLFPQCDNILCLIIVAHAHSNAVSVSRFVLLLMPLKFNWVVNWCIEIFKFLFLNLVGYILILLFVFRYNWKYETVLNCCDWCASVRLQH